MTDDRIRINILVVEDDEDDILLLKQHLSKMTRFDASITVEPDLAQALEICDPDRTDFPYDAVFLDYYWGDKTAEEILGDLSRERSTIPFVVVTSADDFKVNKAVIDAGAWDFIAKPDLSPKLLERNILHIIQRRGHEQELQRLIRHDALTGLGNRVMLEEHLKRVISRCDRHGERCAIIALDLDDFKQINDSLGHNVGDLLLKLVADRLNRELREEDLLVRLGGDEFAVLIENTEGEDQLGKIALKLKNALQAPTPIQGINSNICGSFGIAIYPDNARSPVEMLRYADIALYAAKNGGRNRIHFFDSKLEDALIDELQLTQDLHAAVRDNQFVPFFQPRIDPSNGDILGTEVLVRWQHPSLGLITPDRFIPVAERANLLIQMDRTFISNTLKALAAASLLPGRDIDYRIAFNITAAQLLDRNFTQEMDRLTSEIGLASDHLDFEITEQVLVERTARETLKELRRAGYGLAIDDFGTGFSSFAYLKDLPVSCLKIDRSFVQDVDKEETSNGICEAMTYVGKRLGMFVVAEGVETEEQKEALIRLGVDSLQGFLLARPMPFDQWASYIGAGKKRRVESVR